MEQINQYKLKEDYMPDSIKYKKPFVFGAEEMIAGLNKAFAYISDRGLLVDLAELERDDETGIINLVKSPLMTLKNFRFNTNRIIHLQAYPSADYQSAVHSVLKIPKTHSYGKDTVIDESDIEELILEVDNNTILLSKDTDIRNRQISRLSLLFNSLSKNRKKSYEESLYKLNNKLTFKSADRFITAVEVCFHLVMVVVQCDTICKYLVTQVYNYDKQGLERLKVVNQLKDVHSQIRELKKQISIAEKQRDSLKTRLKDLV